jgi:RimJ/RimL family protein N-acetyltransferase
VRVVEQGETAPGGCRDVILRTERLILTSWLPADVHPLLEMHSDPEAMRFVRLGRPESLAETEQLVAQYMTEHRARGWTKWRLATHDGALLGRAGFGGNDKLRGLSYAIHRLHWGQGLATEIAKALVRWHWQHAPQAGLRALVEVGNNASVAVLRKAGFEQFGTEAYQDTLCLAFVHPGVPSPDGHPLGDLGGAAPSVPSASDRENRHSPNVDAFRCPVSEQRV